MNRQEFINLLVKIKQKNNGDNFLKSLEKLKNEKVLEAWKKNDFGKLFFVYSNAKETIDLCDNICEEQKHHKVFCGFYKQNDFKKWGKLYIKIINKRNQVMDNKWKNSQS